jgi:protein gp37
MADVFEDREDLDWPRRRLFDLIRRTPFLDWQILTKRADVMRDELTMHNFYPPNLWVGVSVEDQEWAERRVPILLDIPARIRFLSCEPLLGPVKLKEWLYQLHGRPPRRWAGGRVNWVIAGGESGGQARPCDLVWIRSLIEELRSAGVPIFVKQLGRRPIISGRNPDWSTWTATSHPDINGIRDPKGGDLEEWPPDLRIRKFPSSQ